jgi:hypothetical protein
MGRSLANPVRSGRKQPQRVSVWVAADLPPYPLTGGNPALSQP